MVEQEVCVCFVVKVQWYSGTSQSPRFCICCDFITTCHVCLPSETTQPPILCGMEYEYLPRSSGSAVQLGR